MPSPTTMLRMPVPACLLGMLLATAAGCDCCLKKGPESPKPDGEPTPAPAPAAIDGLTAPFAAGWDAPPGTADHPASRPTGSTVATGAGLNRRPGWSRALAQHVNTGVRTEPNYFDSPWQDVQVTGGGEPRFWDWRRDVKAGLYEPLRWVVNLAAVPVSGWMLPYWERPLDYGVTRADRPSPPSGIVDEPRTVKLDD